jgi:hypothetical protein
MEIVYSRPSQQQKWCILIATAKVMYSMFITSRERVGGYHFFRLGSKKILHFGTLLSQRRHKNRSNRLYVTILGSFKLLFAIFRHFSLFFADFFLFLLFG